MKKSIAILMILALSVLFVCGCEEDVIYNPTIVIDETLEEDANSNVNSDVDNSDENQNEDNNQNDSLESVDLSDPLVIVGKWELVSHTVDDVEEQADFKYLVITEDRKFYNTNSLNSLSGNYTYEYTEGQITVYLNNQLDEGYAVTMETSNDLSLMYSASAKIYVDTFKKVQ